MCTAQLFALPVHLTGGQDFFFFNLWNWEVRLHRAVPLAPWDFSLMVPRHFFEFPCLTFDSAAVQLVEDQEPPFFAFLVNLFIRPSWVFTPAFLRPALLGDVGPDVWALGPWPGGQ